MQICLQHPVRHGIPDNPAAFFMFGLIGHIFPSVQRSPRACEQRRADMHGKQNPEER